MVPQRPVQITVEVKELVPEWERFASLVNSRRYLEALRFLVSKPLLAKMARRLLGDNMIVEIARAAVLSGAPASIVKQLLERIGVKPPAELDALEMLVKGNLRAAERVAPEPLRSLIRCVLTLCPPQQMASVVRRAFTRYRDVARRLALYYIVEYLASKGYDSRLADVARAVREERLARILEEWPRLPLLAAAEAVASLTRGVVATGRGDVAQLIYYSNEARRLAEEYRRLAEEASRVGDPRRLADIIVKMYRVAERLKEIGGKLEQLGVGRKPDVWKPLLAAVAKLEAVLAEAVAEGRMSEDEAVSIARRVADVIRGRFPKVAATLMLLAQPLTPAEAVCILKKAGFTLPAPPGPVGGGPGGGAARPGRHAMM